MTVHAAEAVFADYMNMKMPDMQDLELTRAMLRDAMMRQRVADDNGVDVSILHDKQRRRKMRAEEDGMLAIECGVGAAANCMTAAEAFFGDPMPNCDRWGSSVALTLSGSVLPLQTHQSFAIEARPSLPTAATVSASERIGPHGLLTNQMHPDRPPITTYYGMLCDTMSAQFGKRPVDYGLAVHAGVSIERDSEDAEDMATDDNEADRQNGLRYWPPRALRGELSVRLGAPPHCAPRCDMALGLSLTGAEGRPLYCLSAFRHLGGLGSPRRVDPSGGELAAAPSPSRRT